MASCRAVGGREYVGGWSYYGKHQIMLDEDYFLQIDSFAFGSKSWRSVNWLEVEEGKLAKLRVRR
jgi:hypothetical protein